MSDERDATTRPSSLLRRRLPRPLGLLVRGLSILLGVLILGKIVIPWLLFDPGGPSEWFRRKAVSTSIECIVYAAPSFDFERRNCTETRSRSHTSDTDSTRTREIRIDLDETLRNATPERRAELLESYSQGAVPPCREQ